MVTSSAPDPATPAEPTKPKLVPRAQLVARIDQLEGELIEETAEKERHRKWRWRYCLTAVIAVIALLAVTFFEVETQSALTKASSQVMDLKKTNGALEASLKACKLEKKEVVEPPKCEQPKPTPQSPVKRVHKPVPPASKATMPKQPEPPPKVAQVPQPQASAACATDCVPLRPSASSTPQVCKMENGKVYCNFPWKVLHTAEDQATCGCKIAQARPTGTVVVGFHTAKEGSQLCHQQQDAFTFIQGDKVVR